MRTLAAALCLLSLPATAADPRQCPYVDTCGGGACAPPSGKVRFTLKSLKLNSDMESDDDYAFWDNRADVFGEVFIDADGATETLEVPMLEDTDFPHWDSGNVIVTRPVPLGRKVHVIVDLAEADPFSSEKIDTSPDPLHDNLIFDFDPACLTVSGDITGSATDDIVVTSGSGSNQGTLTFHIEMDDERPMTTQDVALAGFDLIQVLPDGNKLAATKPTVGLVQVTNNTTASQAVSVHVVITNGGGTLLADRTESLPAIPAGQVAKKYLFTSSPIGFPPAAGCNDYQINATATLILAPGAEPPPPIYPTCRVINNSSTHSYTVAPNVEPGLTWERVALPDGPIATLAEAQAIHDLGSPFIRGVLPVASFSESSSTGVLTATLTAAGMAALVDILGGLGIYADAAKPFMVVFEMSADAALAHTDHVLGILSRDWFDAFGAKWTPVTGLSLGRWMPHAVIFEAASGGGTAAPTLPSHELGHTYGLSVDPSMKDHWACMLSDPLYTIACGAYHGFDEYKSPIVAYQNGLPTWGYWVPQAAAPPALAADTGEQCSSYCEMGNSPGGAESSWRNMDGTINNGRWVDGADYDQLLSQLHKPCLPPSGETIYLSGFIDKDDHAYLGWTFHRAGATTDTPDFPSQPGEHLAAYGIVFLDGNGAHLAESELPLDWHHPDWDDTPLPITFFGGTARFPVGARRVQIWNRVNNTLLLERAITVNYPVLGAPNVTTPVINGVRNLVVTWTATDADGGALTHFVLLSPDNGAHFWPLAHALPGPSATVPIPDVAHGLYLVRAISSDGVQVSSRDVLVQL